MHCLSLLVQSARTTPCHPEPADRCAARRNTGEGSAPKPACVQTRCAAFAAETNTTGPVAGP